MNSPFPLYSKGKMLILVGEFLDSQHNSYKLLLNLEDDNVYLLNNKNEAILVFMFDGTSVYEVKTQTKLKNIEHNWLEISINAEIIYDDEKYYSLEYLQTLT